MCADCAGKLEQDDDGVEWEEVDNQARPSTGAPAGTSCCSGPAAASKNGEFEKD